VCKVEFFIWKEKKLVTAHNNDLCFNYAVYRVTVVLESGFITRVHIRLDKFSRGMKWLFHVSGVRPRCTKHGINTVHDCADIFRNIYTILYVFQG
jgi:hypothetical protein